MTLKELSNKLNELGLSSDSYYLQGLYGSINGEDKIALSIKKVSTQSNTRCTIRKEAKSNHQGPSLMSMKLVNGYKNLNSIHILVG